MKNWIQSLKSLPKWNYVAIAVILWLGSEFLIAITFGLPDEAEQGFSLAQKYNNSIFCRVIYKVPVPLPGETEAEAQDRCFHSAAGYFDDIKICNKIKSDRKKDQCKSPWLTCGEIENEDVRYSCYFNRARDGRIGIEDCESEKRVTEKANCLYGIGYVSLNKKHCDMIPDDPSAGGNKRLCYQRIAIKKMDKKICELIAKEEYAESCKIYVDEKIERQ